MELDIIGLLGACSYALDCVEAELTHVATKHGKRVAYMSVCTAQKMGITGDALQDLFPRFSKWSASISIFMVI